MSRVLLDLGRLGSTEEVDRRLDKAVVEIDRRERRMVMMSRLKIAYSPVWCGLIWVGFSIVFGLAIGDPDWVWWIIQGGLAVLCIVGALVHGHLVWLRKERQRQIAEQLGVPVERTVWLGRNAIGYAKEKEEG